MIFFFSPSQTETYAICLPKCFPFLYCRTDRKVLLHSFHRQIFCSFSLTATPSHPRQFAAREKWCFPRGPAAAQPLAQPGCACSVAKGRSNTFLVFFGSLLEASPKNNPFYIFVITLEKKCAIIPEWKWRGGTFHVIWSLSYSICFGTFLSLAIQLLKEQLCSLVN